MNRSINNTKTFQSIGSYHTKQLQITKGEIVDKLEKYNNRKSSKEETLNDLQLIMDKIDSKLKSFRSN
jgi:hypothetical protein